MEEMLTIDPPPDVVIGSITAFMPSQQPTAFTSSTRRKSASDMSAMRANCNTPALFTSTSSLPKVATVVQHVAEHHLGALGDKVPHVGLAHAPGAAGDQRDLPVEPAHGLLRFPR